MKKSLLILFCLTITISLKSQQVIGGDYVIHGEYPWMVSLEAQGMPLCGAALIAPQWVLTAGHCGAAFPPFIPQPDKVLINLYSRNNPNSDAEYISIEQIFVHPDFDNNSFDGPDIALIKLATASSKTPIMLPGVNDQYLYNTNTACKVLGWGSTDANATQSDTLRIADVYITDYDTCKNNYANSSITWILEDFQICAGYLKDSTAKGAGAGDSGGPLFAVNNNNELVHIGIVSGGNGNITTADYPGVFTRTSAFVDWIDSIITSQTITGISTISNNNFNVFVKGEQLNIISSFEIADPIDIEIYNILGQEMMTSTAAGKNIVIDLTGLKSGVYIVTIKTESGIESKKIYKH